MYTIIITYHIDYSLFKYVLKLLLVSFQNSLLGLEPLNVNKMALECFACVMRYMGDMPLLKNQHEVDCVNTIFVYCRQFEAIRDEV